MKQILNKNKAIDIFHDELFHKQRTGVTGFEKVQRIQTKYFKYKNDKMKYQRLLGTLDIIIKLKLLKGPQHIGAILAYIQFQKEAFIQELEQGVSVEIPRYLGQKLFPFSFRFYDPILKIIQQSVSADKLKYFSLQASFIRYFENKWTSVGLRREAFDRVKSEKNQYSQFVQ